MAKTVRMTVAQAIVKFLDNQYVSMDGEDTKFVEGFFTIFGHGIAVGLGEALDTNPGNLRVLQGRNEQGMCHVATAYAKQNGRKKIIPCASSVGPGAANMVTACATATVNNIPLLVFPADTFASRQPDPVLQQLEQSNSLSTTTNDAFKPVCKYWDRVTRPEHIMTALINAMRVLTDPAETGACCIGLCQDVEGESFDFPEYFFEKRVHRITRPVAVEEEIEDIAGIRIICQFEEDIDTVASIIRSRSDMTIKSEKNYLKHIKQSGYRSYHLIIYYSVDTINGPKRLQAEIQIRTMAMNFWATIEHSLQYKYKGEMPLHVAERLSNAADAIIALDREMSSVRNEIMDAQNSSQTQSNLVKDILLSIENLYKISNKREVEKIQDEFLRVFRTKDLQQLARFHRQLDIIAEGYRAQSVSF